MWSDRKSLSLNKIRNDCIKMIKRNCTPYVSKKMKLSVWVSQLQFKAINYRLVVNRSFQIFFTYRANLVRYCPSNSLKWSSLRRRSDLVSGSRFMRSSWYRGQLIRTCSSSSTNIGSANGRYRKSFASGEVQNLQRFSQDGDDVSLRDSWVEMYLPVSLLNLWLLDLSCMRYFRSL